MISALVFVVSQLIGLVIFVVIVNAVLSWLIAFDVINVRNQTVYRIVRALDAITDPLLAPIRRFVPNLGGIDISPIILILLLQGLQILIRRIAAYGLAGVLS